MRLSPFGDIYKDLCFWKENFLNEKKAFSFSKNTLKAYNNAINEFIEFCLIKQNEIPFKINEINKFIVTMYINYLQDEKNYQSSSIKLYLDAIKQFLKFITENNQDNIDLYGFLENFKVKCEIKEPVFYTFEEIEKIKEFLKAEIEKSKSINKISKYYALLLLIYTGMRAEEVLNLSEKDFNINENSQIIILKIKGKGAKERINYIRLPNLVKETDKYLELKPKSEYLICDKKGNKIKYNTLYKINKNLCKKLNIQNKGLHAYRHAFARMWVNNGYDLQTLKEWLGHSSILVTSKFYARSNESAKMKIAFEIN
jgi:integrase/recombinase XerD